MTWRLGYAQAVGLLGDWFQLSIGDREDQLTLLRLLVLSAWMGTHNSQALVVVQRLQDSILEIRIVPAPV